MDMQEPDTHSPALPERTPADPSVLMLRVTGALSKMELEIRHHLDAEWTDALDRATQGAHDAAHELRALAASQRETITRLTREAIDAASSPIPTTPATDGET